MYPSGKRCERYNSVQDLKTWERDLINIDHMGLAPDVFLYGRALDSSLPQIAPVKSVKLLMGAEHEALTPHTELRLVCEQGQHFGCSGSISHKKAVVRPAAK